MIKGPSEREKERGGSPQGSEMSENNFDFSKLNGEGGKIEVSWQRMKRERRK